MNFKPGQEQPLRECHSQVMNDVLAQLLT
jgi:hypothetical protein